MKNLKYILGGLVIIVALFAAYTHLTTKTVSVMGGDSNTSFPDGLIVGGGTYASTTSLTVFGPSNFASSTYSQAGSVSGGICSLTPASTTVTLYLTAANVQGCSLLSITNASTTALNVTYPASSTMTAFANPGDSAQMYIYAASTTGGNLIIQASTTAGFAIASPIGIASTTAASSTVAAGTTGLLDIVRLPTTNLVGVITPTK